MLEKRRETNHMKVDIIVCKDIRVTLVGKEVY